MSLSQEALSAATGAINEYRRLLIVPHANVDPDGLSSALACYQLFSALGKEVTVVCPETPPESLDFLPGFEKLTEGIRDQEQYVVTINLDEGVEVDKLRYTVEDRKVNIIVVPKGGQIQPNQVSFAAGDQPFDMIVLVDTADLALLGSLYKAHVDLFSSVPILNIDHHISNTGYGQIQLIDPTAASATEVIYHWMQSEPTWKKNLTPDLATLLLTGLITDTRSFQNPNTTPRSLEVAAELLDQGARQQEIIQHIFKTKPLSTLKLWGRALNHIQVDSEAGIVWSSISKEDLAEMGATSKESHGLLDELISTIPDAHLYVLFTELEEGGLKASMRSSHALDVSKLAAREFGGGGHPRASGFRRPASENFELQVLECVRKLKDGMQLQMKEANEPRSESVESPQKPALKPSQDLQSAAPAEQPEAEPSKDVLKGMNTSQEASGANKKQEGDIVEGLQA